MVCRSWRRAIVNWKWSAGVGDGPSSTGNGLPELAMGRRRLTTSHRRLEMSCQSWRGPSSTDDEPSSIGNRLPELATGHCQARMGQYSLPSFRRWRTGDRSIGAPALEEVPEEDQGEDQRFLFRDNPTPGRSCKAGSTDSCWDGPNTSALASQEKRMTPSAGTCWNGSDGSAAVGINCASVERDASATPRCLGPRGVSSRRALRRPVHTLS
jgi:hypothetical protein